MKPLHIFLSLTASLAATLSTSNAWAANQEHINQLEGTGKCPGCDLSGVSLVGIDLAKAQLQNANLNGANFTGANLSGADLTGISAVGANFLGADLQNTTLEKANLVYANLVKVKLNNSRISRTDLQGANLAEADLTGAKITKTNFVGANLFRAKGTRSLREQSNGNFFAEGESNVTIDNRANIIDKPVNSSTFEGGGPPRVIRRRYRIPVWIGTAITSSVGGTKSLVGK
jgi:uncharacterized protein YjbI with pentapeptide repeats